MKIKIVRLVNGRGGGEIGTDGRGRHERFPQKNGPGRKHRAKNDGEKKQVRQAVEPPGFLGGFPFRTRAARG